MNNYDKTPKVTSQVYIERGGVPIGVTTFSDGYAGRYMSASAQVCRELIAQARYAPSTRAGAAIRFALASMGA